MFIYVHTYVYFSLSLSISLSLYIYIYIHNMCSGLAKDQKAPGVGLPTPPEQPSIRKCID